MEEAVVSVAAADCVGDTVETECSIPASLSDKVHVVDEKSSWAQMCDDDVVFMTGILPGRVKKGSGRLRHWQAKVVRYTNRHMPIGSGEYIQCSPQKWGVTHWIKSADVTPTLVWATYIALMKAYVTSPWAVEEAKALEAEAYSSIYSEIKSVIKALPRDLHEAMMFNRVNYVDIQPKTWLFDGAKDQHDQFHGPCSDGVSRPRLEDFAIWVLQKYMSEDASHPLIAAIQKVLPGFVVSAIPDSETPALDRTIRVAFPFEVVKR